MKSALIGFTGFIGSNLATQFSFNDFYNSKNIEEIEGKEYDLIVSAGNSGVKWIANKEPQKDKESIIKLKDALAKVKSKKFILISTVDVYPNTKDINEDAEIDKNTLMPYGKHRYELEQFILKTFNNVTIARLSQVVGPGLKKNFIYDLVHNNRLDLVDYRTIFQWYNIEHFFRDINKAIENNIKLINLTGVPISARETAKQVFNKEFNNTTETGPIIYDIQTKYDAILGTNNSYANTHSEIIKDLKRIIKNI